MKELKCEPCLQEHLIVLTQRKIFLSISILEEQTDFHWKNNFRDTDHKKV